MSPTSQQIEQFQDLVSQYNQANTLPAVFAASQPIMDLLKDIFANYKQNPTVETLGAYERAVALWTTASDAKNAQIAACNEKLRRAADLMLGAPS